MGTVVGLHVLCFGQKEVEIKTLSSLGLEKIL